MKKLRPKEVLFVKEYLKDKNATRAYVAVGYSKKGARQAAHNLLTKTYVKQAVEEGLAKLAEKADISAERTLKELAALAYQELSKSEMKTKSTNKLRALELVGKHFKMFTDVAELSGKDGEAIQVVLTLPKNGSESSGSN